MKWDPQVFGITASFPFAFIGATFGAVLAGLLVAGMTDSQVLFILAQIVTANVCAALIGSRLGPKLEQWYWENKADDEQRKELLAAVPDVEKPIKGEQPEFKEPPRNTGFKICLLIAIILGNVGGALCGGAILAAILGPPAE
mmetsp:Transcript_1829/g.2553  ORF Transcript_1829/g.2553 Transcript_1829/m.2553 type:complete len:142 (-) Transcript_1829:410-835(-)|eukprot:CAMPEP_0113933830 /NCGR_PEP_ID=MMETSP1339-20121228/1147_1 /TAXON_ID=94617 /ORGANISM="Fibrocapsa japonica" /LENGTH=141 /DNA_ID=CAMNT_0000935315 /DNA_START=105 /DNA_END=530 /DNA_ORIENTATION=+ /assembly_acc=CAM_ASM_000762